MTFHNIALLTVHANNLLGRTERTQNSGCQRVLFPLKKLMRRRQTIARDRKGTFFLDGNNISWCRSTQGK